MSYVTGGSNRLLDSASALPERAVGSSSPGGWRMFSEPAVLATPSRLFFSTVGGGKFYDHKDIQGLQEPCLIHPPQTGFLLEALIIESSFLARKSENLPRNQPTYFPIGLAPKNMLFYPSPSLKRTSVFL